MEGREGIGRMVYEKRVRRGEGRGGKCMRREWEERDKERKK